tara:strand:- start:1140 stop:1472 length:333 start_codon:yes stop_codon:yes gene_type:complete
MELSDLFSDLEQHKTLSLTFFGFITGSVARLINFEERVKKSKRKLFSENKNVERRSVELMVSSVAGVTSINYGGPLVSDFGEGLTYTALFRLGYEAGYQITKNMYFYTRQ